MSAKYEGRGPGWETESITWSCGTTPSPLWQRPFDTLRTNLQYISLDKPLKRIMVTSALPSEGKTTIASNLALALADAGNRTILTGVDLRKPAVHKLFGCDNTLGVTTILTGHATLDQALQQTAHPDLRLLASGPVPPNPAEMLGSRAMRALIDELTDHADVVIFDVPPVIAVTDAALLAPAVDGALLVVSMGQTPREIVRQAKEQLEKVNATILGVVANRIALSRGDSITITTTVPAIERRRWGTASSPKGNWPASWGESNRGSGAEAHA